MEDIADDMIIDFGTYRQGITQRNSGCHLAGVVGRAQSVACRIVGMDNLVAIGKLDSIGQIEQVVTNRRNTTVFVKQILPLAS